MKAQAKGAGLRRLHAIWAQLERQRSALADQVDALEIGIGGAPSEGLSRDPRVFEMVDMARRLGQVERAVARKLRQLASARVRTVGDLAALLDVLSACGIVDVTNLDRTKPEARCALALVRGVARLAPGVELIALPADAADAPPAPAVAAAPEIKARENARPGC